MEKNLRYYRQELLLSQIELSQVTQVPRYKIQLCERSIKCLTNEEAFRIFKKLGLPDLTMPEWLLNLIDCENYE